MQMSNMGFTIFDTLPHQNIVLNAFALVKVRHRAFLKMIYFLINF